MDCRRGRGSVVESGRRAAHMADLQGDWPMKSKLVTALARDEMACASREDLPIAGRSRMLSGFQRTRQLSRSFGTPYLAEATGLPVLEWLYTTIQPNAACDPEGSRNT